MEGLYILCTCSFLIGWSASNCTCFPFLEIFKFKRLLICSTHTHLCNFLLKRWHLIWLLKMMLVWKFSGVYWILGSWFRMISNKTVTELWCYSLEIKYKLWNGRYEKEKIWEYCISWRVALLNLWKTQQTFILYQNTQEQWGGLFLFSQEKHTKVQFTE